MPRTAVLLGLSLSLSLAVKTFALPNAADSLEFDLDGDWKSGVMRRDIFAGVVDPAPAGYEQLCVIFPTKSNTRSRLHSFRSVLLLSVSTLFRYLSTKSELI